MAEFFFHLPDDIVFHGIPGDNRGYTFGDCRALSSDQDKLVRLKNRLDGYYSNALKEINHPFLSSILTCVGLEVLGQVIYGFNQQGESIEANTIRVYEMLDPNLASPLSAKFRQNYNRNRNEQGSNIDYAGNFSNYARVIRKGLRNSFTHSYRSLGVFLNDAQPELMIINEDEGYLVLNPEIFRSRFITLYEDCFVQIFSNSNPAYRTEALKYFELLIK